MSGVSPTTTSAPAPVSRDPYDHGHRHPDAPASADRVEIKKARWKQGLLTIEATSTNPNAILSVHSQSGSFMFTLTNQGGGRYFDQRGWVSNPQVITVRSNLDGSATRDLDQLA